MFCVTTKMQGSKYLLALDERPEGNQLFWTWDQKSKKVILKPNKEEASNLLRSLYTPALYYLLEDIDTTHLGVEVKLNFKSPIPLDMQKLGFIHAINVDDLIEYEDGVKERRLFNMRLLVQLPDDQGEVMFEQGEYSHFTHNERKQGKLISSRYLTWKASVSVV